MKRGWKFELHDFYCINCGERTMTLPRNVAKKKEKFHRKKLYCPTCKITINQIECRNEWEAWEFKRDFEEGVYKDECEQEKSLLNGGSTGVGEEHIS